MSMYDNFRAPQYVDFSSPDDSADSSSFFDGNLENVSMVPAVGGSRPRIFCQAGIGDDSADSSSFFGASQTSSYNVSGNFSLVGGGETCPSPANSTMEADETTIVQNFEIDDGNLENVSMVPAVGGSRPRIFCQAGIGDDGADSSSFFGASQTSSYNVSGNISLGGGETCPSPANSTIEADETTIVQSFEIDESESDDASIITAVGGSSPRPASKSMETLDSVSPQSEMNYSDFEDASMVPVVGSTPYPSGSFSKADGCSSQQAGMNRNDINSLVDKQNAKSPLSSSACYITPRDSFQSLRNSRKVVSPSTLRLCASTPIVNKQQVSGHASNQRVKINVIPPTPSRGTSTSSIQNNTSSQSGSDCTVQINIIPPTPDCSLRNINNNFIVSSPSKSNSGMNTRHDMMNSERKSHTGKPINRRRSLSESASLPLHISSEADVECMLQAAMADLAVSCKKVRDVSKDLPAGEHDLPAQHDFPAQQSKVRATRSSILRQSLACIKSDQSVKSSRQGVGRPKRKLSPPNKHVPDYSQQPEKFISMAEHITKIQKQTPARFRCQRRPLVSKQERNQPPVGEKPETGVKVARWPAPKVVPFKPTTYKKKEMTSDEVHEFTAKSHPIKMGKVAYMLQGPNNFKKVYVGNMGTPMSKPVAHRVTKVEPFSFDQRDQEFIAKKVARLQQSRESYQNGITCSQHTNRRRSKSQGAENCKVSKGDFHARLPTVLHKPPFVPKKNQQVPTKPIDLKLNTQQRAQERAEFDRQLNERHQRNELLRREQELKLQEEEQKNIARLRKELVYKARPAPIYKPFKVKPSCAPLTEPETPSFMHRTRERAQIHQEDEDDSMDE